MKRFLLFCTLLLPSGALISAVPGWPVSISASGSLVYSRIVGEDDSWRDALGAQGGVAVHLRENSGLPLRLLAEANISMQGARYENDWEVGLVEGLTRLVYFHVPLVARYQWGHGLYAEAGIQPGILLLALDKFYGESYSYRDWVNSFDLGIPVGVGYGFANHIGVGLRVIPGLININKGGAEISVDRNFVVALRASYVLVKKSP